ncbi:MAG TPA: DUF3034 family protein [Steroidobacteraceae bacterium]|nr:DUF3034 family protein [Steroidobacteraceae bacterium]
MRWTATATFLCFAVCGPPSITHAGSRLLGSNGVMQVEGAAGGGLVPWALIAGLATRGEVGASASCTRVEPEDFSLLSCGAALGFDDRLELSFARQEFDLGTTVPGESIRLDVIGAKVRILGDAIFGASKWLPQIAVGMQYKENRDYDLVPKLLGARDASSVDYYVAATKVFIDGIAGRMLLVNATLRATEANQLGLLGFGGDEGEGYSVQPEFSVGVFLTDQIVVGAEYRFKPDNLSVFEEDDFSDVFVAWIPYKSIALTVAYARLGTIADKEDQKGLYGSLQLAF